jgi:hypothetical protein
MLVLSNHIKERVTDARQARLAGEVSDTVRFFEIMA